MPEPEAKKELLKRIGETVLSHASIAHRTAGQVSVFELVSFLYSNGVLTDEQIAAVASAIDHEIAAYRRKWSMARDHISNPSGDCDTAGQS